MTSRFHFAHAFWFRVPLKLVVITMAAFALVSLAPAFTEGTASDRERALFGIGVALAFIVMGSVLLAAINESYIDLDDRALSVRFEGFFGLVVPLADVAEVRMVDPRPRWRYRLGLSSDFRERVCASHGGQIVELRLAAPVPAQLWPRRLAIRRLWLGVRDADAFIAELRRRSPAPRALALPASG
jgi:hypothetical protein